MAQIYLGLALHNHQPVGNFGWVFADAYRDAYLPMVEALEAHPAIRMSLHYTGPLIDWLREHEPGFLGRVATLVRRGQVEMMTGAYYEPILPSIPDADKVGQIRYLSQVVRQELGGEPTGLWIAERVWEPHLPRFTREADVDWTILDDTHFHMAGLDDSQLLGYYVTEEQGATLGVFPSSKRLRYLIPWAGVDEVIDYLRGLATANGARIIVMGDDGEKFGVWPSTNDHCWKRGWMDRFFTAVEKNASWLKLIPVGEYAARYPAVGRVYLPSASYAEMMEWALPPLVSADYTALVHRLQEEDRTDIIRFTRGGFWRNFLVKYEEVNTMHKKMLLVHEKVYGRDPLHSHGPLPPTGRHGDRATQRPRTLAASPRLPVSPSEGEGTGTGAMPLAGTVEALHELWRGQCNCPYWHGVFGGVYMTDVRTAVFRHLIAAEALADAQRHGDRPWIDWRLTDFDRDAREELLIEGSSVNLYFNLLHGGALFEWDLRAARHNLQSTMTRRREAYHELVRVASASSVTSAAGKEASNAERAPAGANGEAPKTIHESVRVKEAGLEKRLTYDWYRRGSLIDHFLHPATGFDDFAACQYGEAGDFVDQPYQAEVTREGTALHARLWRDGHVWMGPSFVPVRVEKQLTLEAGSETLEIAYRVTNRGQVALDVPFGVELNLNLLGGGHNPAAYCTVPDRPQADTHFDAAESVDGVSRLEIGNHGLRVRLGLETDRPANLWRFSVDSVSSSEGGFERVHQGSCFLLRWDLHLEPGAMWNVGLRCGCHTESHVL